MYYFEIRMIKSINKTDIDIERFESNISKTDTCWLWTGTCQIYGNFGMGRKVYRAHRISYLLYIGEISKNSLVLHKCDNTICVNPEHLFLGTHKDNMKDMVHKGRASKQTGELGNSAKLTTEQILKIREDNRFQSEIAKDYNVQQSTISHIKNRKRWKHVK